MLGAAQQRNASSLDLLKNSSVAIARERQGLGNLAGSCAPLYYFSHDLVMLIEISEAFFKKKQTN